MSFLGLFAKKYSFNQMIRLLDSGDIDGLRKASPDSFRPVTEKGLTLAHFAADLGNVSALEIIAKKAPETLVSASNNGTTPAFVAANKKHLECLRLLAESGSLALDKVTDFGITPVGAAIFYDFAPGLEVMIASVGPDCLRKTGPEIANPAHWAVHSGFVESLRVLARHLPAMLSEQDTAGQTPGFIAAGKGNLECLRIIAEANPTSLSIQNNKGWTPADAAQREGHSECVRYLGDLGFRVHVESEESRIIRERAAGVRGVEVDVAKGEVRPL